MDEDLPLGLYDQFRFLTGRSFPWGPDARWRAWFAGGVVDGLAQVMDEHAERLRSGYQRGLVGTGAIGCVPWLTSGPILERLAALAGCCVVIHKGASREAARVLAERDNGMPNVSPGLRDLAPTIDGHPVVLGPTSEMPMHALGPLRVAGWRKRGRSGPLMHAKILVLGELRWAEDDFGSEDLHFFRQSVWWGSANWTAASANHLEVGFWSDDPALVGHMTSFVESVIAFSEPWDSLAEGPEPDLASVEFDDDALREYMAEFGPFSDGDEDE